MVISFSQIIVWLIIGGLGGTLAGALVRWQREGFGVWTNLGIGLVGAVVGGVLFRLFGHPAGPRDHLYFAARRGLGIHRIDSVSPRPVAVAEARLSRAGTKSRLPA